MWTTPVYAALFALLFIALSVRTLRLRRSARIAVGDGDNPRLLRAMRAHANFAEYVPLTLLLLYFVETQVGAGSILIHVAAGLLLVGRIIHALGISRVAEDTRFRVAGMALTFTVLGGSALLVLGFSLFDPTAL